MGKAQYLSGHPLISESSVGTIYVTNDAVVYSYGMFKKAVIGITDIVSCNVKTEAEISKDVTLSRLLLMGVFAFGAKKKRVSTTFFLTITCRVDGNETNVIFKDDDAHAHSAKIYKLLQKYKKIIPQPKLQPQPEKRHDSNRIYKLKTLVDLLNSGGITQEEYEHEKKILLGEDEKPSPSSDTENDLSATVCPKCGGEIVFQIAAEKKGQGCLMALLWIVLLLIPFFGWIALVVLWKKQKSKTRLWGVCQNCEYKERADRIVHAIT